MKRRDRPFLIGLTGSIGMGKSTAAQMFADEGAAVWDADAAVHRLYAPGGKAVAPVAALFPDAVKDGAVQRATLQKIIARSPEALKDLQDVVHPLVAEDRAAFIMNTDAPIVVLDVPLLFETGAADVMDLVAVVSTDPETQKSRVMAREGMTSDLFDRVKANQMPDAQKRAKADVVIPTDDLETTRRAVQNLMAEVRKNLSDA